MTKPEIILTAASIRTIAEVLLTNADICELYEKRGVSREEIRLICLLAEGQVQPNDPRKCDCSRFERRHDGCCPNCGADEA